ncbi:hypothetical protein NW759_002816 [Fusarium solani]|nr:hypothetical protein NW759_002816 [Fusarium solani]
MTVARQLALALYERVATKKSFLTATQSRPSVDCGIPKHLGDVGDASDANEYDAGASDDGAEEDSIHGVDDTSLWHRTVLKMCKVPEEQAKANESHLVFDFKTLLLDNDYVQDDAKVQARIDFLLRPEIARCYWYSPEVDAAIEAATPGLLEQPVLCDDVQKILDRYRCRWDAFLRANARLALSLTLPEASDLGIATEWYRWTVANARKADRDRIVQRFLHFGNHPLDVQIILGQDCWTEQLFRMLVPVDLSDPAYDGQLFNTSYLGIVQSSGVDPCMEQYYGSATGSGGEASRLSDHERFLCKDSFEMRVLRGQPTSGALYFHEVGVTPGAQHSFHYLFRFPKTQHRAASIHSRLLAFATEHFNIVSTGKLNRCSIRRGGNYIQQSELLMGYFKSQVNLPRREPGQNIGVLNRVLPICQQVVPYFLHIDLADNDLADNHLFDRVYATLETFYLKTSKRKLTYEDIMQLVGELGGSSPDLPGMVQRLRASYEKVLAAHGETYQLPYDDLTIPAVAGVLRYAFSEGFASEPCPANDNDLSFCDVDTTYFDWQKVAIEAQKLLNPNLCYLCTPKAVRDIWVSGSRVGGISRLALILRNAQFLRDSFSGNTDEINFASSARLKPVMRERLRQLCRHQLHEDISGDMTFDDLEVEFEKGVPLLKWISRWGGIRRLVGGLLERVTSKLVDGLRKDRQAYVSEASIRSCFPLMSWIEALLRTFIRVLTLGMVSRKV